MIQHMRRKSATGWTSCCRVVGSVICILLVAIATAGCTTLDQIIESATVADADARLDSIESLDAVVRESRPGDPLAVETRAKIEAFLRSRFESDPETKTFREPAAILRSQLLSLAVAGEFDCATDLIKTAARDRRSPGIRLFAITHMRDYEVVQFRDILIETLQVERDLFVRIEAVKTIANAVIDQRDLAPWVDPLLKIFFDPTEPSSLRVQSYRAVRRLSGKDFHFENANAWQKWYTSLAAGRS